MFNMHSKTYHLPHENKTNKQK